ncbi:MAG TPA: signal recognition particle-docking protein FtsY [Rhodanobacteraceae bacterium]|nr:signal recognition particle-docking protein FtsY [Rhodanobacteraceae bacterium]
MLKFFKRKGAKPQRPEADDSRQLDEAGRETSRSAELAERPVGRPQDDGRAARRAAKDAEQDRPAGRATPEPAVAEPSPSPAEASALPLASVASPSDDAGRQQPEVGELEQPAGGDAIGSSDSGKRRGWRQRLAGSGFSRGIGGLFSRNPKLDDALLDELETSLITADVGVTLSTRLSEDLRRRMHKREFADAAALLTALRDDLVAILEPVARPLDVSAARPFVLLMVGVNGVGKTTTVGKLARRFRSEGRRVLLAAGDTFRAAAVEQLQAWGERNDVPVIAQGQGADSASVVFDALQSARARGSDVLIADTAGRLHTQGGLMDELAKVRRVLARLDADAPHETLLVLDGGTGQNAISQVRQFQQAAGVTGLAVTKLDGTAKGGVVFALAAEFGLPIRYVGLGEGVEDLAPFDPAAFVDALLPSSLGAAAA